MADLISVVNMLTFDKAARYFSNLSRFNLPPLLRYPATNKTALMITTNQH